LPTVPHVGKSWNPENDGNRNCLVRVVTGDGPTVYRSKLLDLENVGGKLSGCFLLHAPPPAGGPCEVIRGKAVQEVRLVGS